MNHKHFLLSAFLLPIVFTMHGQSPDEQRIQQLKDALYQKAQELERLGEKLIEKNKLFLALHNDTMSLAREFTSNYSQQDRNAVYEALPVSIKKLYNKLFQAIRDNVDVKGVLIQELWCNKGDYLKNKEDCPEFLDSIKLILFQVVIEIVLTKKLLEDYEDCLQKMAEIEHELVLLGQPRLLMSPCAMDKF